MAKLTTKIQLRRDTAANLADIVLASGEPGFTTDTQCFAIGDGVTPFKELPKNFQVVEFNGYGPNSLTLQAVCEKIIALEISHCMLMINGYSSYQGYAYVQHFGGTNYFVSLFDFANMQVLIKEAFTNTETLYIEDALNKLKPLVFEDALDSYVTLDTAQTISGVKTFSTQQKFTVANGTSPFTVASSTKVTNLNADLLDGKHASEFQPAGNYLTSEADTLQTVTNRGATTTNAIEVAGLKSTGNVSIYAASGATPYLLFQRGTDTDSYNDWGMFGSGGSLYFKNRGSGGTWGSRVTFLQGGGITLDAGNLNVASGTATANSFIKRNSSDSYVLLGGGGHKALSEFSASDTKVTQSNTTTANWHKVILSKQNSATMGTATTETTDVVYVTPKIEAQPSTGSLRMTGNMLLHNPDGGDSPKLVFQRGDEKGNVTDWNMYVQSGALKINSVPTSNDTTERNIAEFAYSGGMTIYSPSNTAGVETASMTVKTSNGGQLIIGKEGPNSGTMLRFDQETGKTRLRFRSSSTAGAMVWEQPEKAARLYLDFGNDAGTGVNRVNVPNPEGGGTLATQEWVENLGYVTGSYLPLAGGTMTGDITITAGKGLVMKYTSGGDHPWMVIEGNTSYGIRYKEGSPDTMMFSASGNNTTAAGADLCINGNGDGTVTMRGKNIATQNWVESKGYLTSHQSLTGYVKGSSLTKDSIILGNDGSNIKTSSKTISTAVGTDDTTIPTSKAIVDYIDGLGYVTGSYLPLSGSNTTNSTNNMTGPILFKDVNGIILNSNNKDVKVWSIWGNAGAYTEQYGFHLLYKGTGGGNDNSLHLYAHDTTSTHKEVYSILQDGTTTWKQSINFKGGIQEDGTALSAKYQALDADLTAIAGVAGNAGFLKKTAANTWALEELSIPAAQIQSDWNQTDTTKLDFIKNKPTSNAEGNRTANQIVIAKAAGTINSEKYSITSGTTTKATWQYNSSTECIELVWA